MNLQEHFDAAMELAQSPTAPELVEAVQSLIEANPEADTQALLEIAFYAGFLCEQADEDDPVLASISNDDALNLMRSLLNRGEVTVVIST